MFSENKKPILIFYKNFSKLYGNYEECFLIQNNFYRNFSLNFFNDCTLINKIDYNFNEKKILESSENLYKDLKELMVVLKLKDNLDIIKQEIKREKAFLKKFGKLSIFKNENEHSCLKSKIKLSFFTNINKKKFAPEKSFQAETLNGVLPLTKFSYNLDEKFKVYFFCSSKIFPISAFNGNSTKIFNRTCIFILRLSSRQHFKWVYSYGLIFRCSIIYFFLPMNFLKKTSWNIIVHKFLQFHFFYTIFLKLIMLPVTLLMKFHKKPNKLGENFVFNILKCFKKRSTVNFCSNFTETNFLFTQSPQNITMWILNCFGQYMKKKIARKNSSQIKKIALKFFSYLYYFPRNRKISNKKIHEIITFIEKLGKMKPLKNLIRGIFSKKFPCSIYYINIKSLLIQKPILSFLRENVLFKNPIERDSLTILTKLEQKKLNFEVGIKSKKNHLGSELRLTIFCPRFLKTSFSTKIKSEWQFFRIVLSTKKSGNISNNPICFPSISILTKKYGVNFKSNFFKIQTIDLPKKKYKIQNIYYKLDFFRKNFLSFSDSKYELNLKLYNSLYNIFNSNNIEILNSKVFFIFKKIQNLKRYYRKNFFLLLLISLVCWLNFTKDSLKSFPGHMYKVLEVICKKDLNFLHKINIEYFTIMLNYKKK
jgi:hypothetical protein